MDLHIDRLEIVEEDFVLGVLDSHGVSLEMLQLIGIFISKGLEGYQAAPFIRAGGSLENLGQHKYYNEHKLWTKVELYDP